jgi:thiol-disulfide isomerase/thioredoxin
MPAANAAELTEYRGDTPTPPLELVDIHGQPHTLADYRGKVVLVNFWAGWCGPCLQEIPELIALAEILAERPFVILAVNTGEPDRKLTGYVKSMNEHMVILMDRESTAFERWNGIGLPSTFVLDASGKIRYEAFGPVNWDRPDVVATFTDLMTAPVVDAAATTEHKQ